MSPHYIFALLGTLYFTIGPHASCDKIITVTDNVFTPNATTITVGQTVCWQSANTTAEHNVTQASSPENALLEIVDTSSSWDPNNLTQNVNYSHTFNTEGDFYYYCSVHAISNNMVGNITVVSATTPPQYSCYDNVNTLAQVTVTGTTCISPPASNNGRQKPA